jgi:2-isopropylmalate synthase
MSHGKLVIFDTTLRDGEQSPGVRLTRDMKVEIAKMLERLGVDVIEAGFAVSGQSDFESIRAIARAVTESTVCSLSRAVDKDIDLSAEAIRPARSGRIHIVLATSPIHMKHKLMMEPADVLELGVRSVKRARRYSDDVEFSCEDASRSDLEFLTRFVEAVIAAGATTVSLPDTTGYATPGEYGRIYTHLLENAANANEAVLSAHCHNDLGLAVANSLEAVRCGARQIECTINGIGERAGNASLEEIVMALRTRHDYFGFETAVNTKLLVPASRLVSEATGFDVQPNKAIVGRNAFAHASGIHQDGMLKNPLTYQIMTADDVGWSQYRLVLGKHSGHNGYRTYMTQLGVQFASHAELDEAFVRFKELVERKWPVDQDDILATALRPVAAVS